MQPVYHVLSGPTAAGKTGHLLAIASSLPLIVISADSRQVYRYMDIGTGKPTKAELKILPHYGVDRLEPGIKYSVYQFLTFAAQAFAVARGTGCQVWVCGGTGLYLHSLLAGFDLGGAPRPELRLAITQRINVSSARQVADALGLKLADPDNPVRVIRQAEHACTDRRRACEIYTWAGLDLDCEQCQPAQAEAVDVDAREELARWRCAGVHVLDPGRDELLKRIETRIAGMFNSGLVDEVVELRRRGFGQADVVSEGIAYREAGRVLDGELAVPEAIERAVIRTRQYAKRQRTYFKGRGWSVVNDAELSAMLAKGPQSAPE